jgi:hypothetical protein
MRFAILLQNVPDAAHALIYLALIQIEKGHPYGGWFTHSKAANITHFVIVMLQLIH